MKRFIPFLTGLLLLAVPRPSLPADQADIQQDQANLAASEQDLVQEQQAMAGIETQLTVLEANPVANASQIAGLWVEQTLTQVRIDEDLAKVAYYGGDITADQYLE